MLTNEMALEVRTQAPAGALTPALNQQLSYTTTDVSCQAFSDMGIVPLVQIEQQLNDAAQKCITTAQQALDEACVRIQADRATREKAIAAARAALADEQQQLQGLSAQRETFEQRTRVFLRPAEREAMLAQIHLAFNTRQLEIESTIEQSQRELDALEAEHNASILAEELELELLRGDVETLQQAAPEVAEQVQLAMNAQTNLENAIRFAREGAVVEAEHALASAKAGGAGGDQIVGAEGAIAEAKQRVAARELIAAIQAVEAEAPGAVAKLKQIAQRATEGGVLSKVQPFLNRVLKLARAAAITRYREAAIHADHLAEQGLIPCISDGRMEAWKLEKDGWLLIDVWTYRDGTWVGSKPRVRLVRQNMPRRVRKSRWNREKVRATNMTLTIGA